MKGSETIFALVAGGLGVAAAASLEAAGVATVLSSLVGLTLVVLLIAGRRWWRARGSQDE